MPAQYNIKVLKSGTVPEKASAVEKGRQKFAGG
jgi:hypothetical protein